MDYSKSAQAQNAVYPPGYWFAAQLSAAAPTIGLGNRAEQALTTAHHIRHMLDDHHKCLFGPSPQNAESMAPPPANLLDTLIAINNMLSEIEAALERAGPQL